MIQHGGFMFFLIYPSRGKHKTGSRQSFQFFFHDKPKGSAICPPALGYAKPLPRFRALVYESVFHGVAFVILYYSFTNLSISFMNLSISSIIIDVIRWRKLSSIRLNVAPWYIFQELNFSFSGIEGSFQIYQFSSFS